MVEWPATRLKIITARGEGHSMTSSGFVECEGSSSSSNSHNRYIVVETAAAASLRHRSSSRVTNVLTILGRKNKNGDVTYSIPYLNSLLAHAKYNNSFRVLTVSYC